MPRNFKKLEGLANKLGYKVRLNRVNQCSVHDKLIKIDSRQRSDRRVFALAHELGHAKTLLTCKRKLGCLTSRGNDNTWSTLEAEFVAWEYADKEVKLLGLYGRDYLKFKHREFGAYYRYKD